MDSRMKRCIAIGLGGERCYNCQRWWVINWQEERRDAENCKDFLPFDDGKHPIKKEAKSEK